jgi:hypothetical protein
MAWYALIEISSNNILQTVDGEKEFPRNSGLPPVLKPTKGLKWLPLITTLPIYDSNTETREGPVITVTPTQVTKVWTVRSKTAQELDTILNNTVIGQFTYLKPLIKALNDGSFIPGQNLTNSQLRAILKAQQ